MVKMNYSFIDEGNLSLFLRTSLVICSKGKSKKPSSLLVEDDRREALLLGHSSMRASVVHERFDIVLDHLAAAIHALFSNVSPFFPCTRWWRRVGCLKRTMTVSFFGLTGRPLALTGARVPAASAFLCSRWIWKGQH